MAPYEPPSPFEKKEVNTLDEKPALIKAERLVPVDSKRPIDRLRSHFDADHLFIVVQLD